MPGYKLESPFSPSGDQPEAIEKLVQGANKEGVQTLLGVTGSGKTFTIANLIAATGKTCLVISHNKTLAAQLYSEFKQFFPKNKVGYFVSYYDYYQPESYIPQTDTYIEKDAQINEKIERLRLQSTAHLLSPGPAVIVSTVSCIYGLGSPKEWLDASVQLQAGATVARSSLLASLISIQYERSEFELLPGIFRVKGNTIDIVPGYQQEIIRIILNDDKIERLQVLEPVSARVIEELQQVRIFPAKHYIVPQSSRERALRDIRLELEQRLPELSDLEAHRLKMRTRYDLELIEELGYCKGIENYSRHFDGRSPGQPPYTLMDFLPKDAIIVIDESHVTIPQLHGMYHGDHTRKKNLVDYGFRLPCAYDNRPLKFEEFEKYMNNTVFVSATPSQYEQEHSFQVVEQLVRPTGLLDPQVSIRPTKGQIDDLMKEVQLRASKNERTLVTTLTKRMAEDLTDYMTQKGVKVRYLHSEIETIQRTEIIRRLRLGEFDCLVGINLLREGLDIPEVSLVAILDADKEGFLRNETSLVQTIGRAARNINGTVILYCDRRTEAIESAVLETDRRRRVQDEFNRRHGITPKTIQKNVAASQLELKEEEKKLGKVDLRALAINLEMEMQKAAEDLDFEKAIELRDQLLDVQRSIGARKTGAKKAAGRKAEKRGKKESE
ncbi:TPA: excinuclease ABC subunit UvrB [Candidatus Micrarchaeota archaeon]|nr:excinuclease ABC subunit UvrB [Candidatus Micrarchaeota archaeon]